MKTEKEYLKPEQFGLSNDDCRPKKVIDLLDENGIKPILELKASTLVSTESTTSRAFLVTTIVGQTTRRGAKY